MKTPSILSTFKIALQNDKSKHDSFTPLILFCTILKKSVRIRNSPQFLYFREKEFISSAYFLMTRLEKACTICNLQQLIALCFRILSISFLTTTFAFYANCNLQNGLKTFLCKIFFAQIIGFLASREIK